MKGRKERIMEDWKTWKERKMRWRLDETARKEERNGKSLNLIWKDMDRRAMVGMGRAGRGTKGW